MTIFAFMATIKFIIQSNNNPSGIYVRVRDGQNIDIKAKTNFYINPRDWSAAKGQPKNLKDEEHKKLNANLSHFSTKLLHHYNNATDKSLVNTQWLKDFINPPDEVIGIPNTLIQYIEYYTKHKKNEVGSSTYKRNNTYKHLIERFEKSKKKKFLIKDINADFKLEFENYCTSQNYAPNTTARTVKFIKTVCRHARNNGIETHFQLDSLTARLQKVEKIYLTSQELELINKVKLKPEHLDNARDWLIISCETGQRVSDFMRFTKDQIRIQDGKHLIEFTQVKTGKLMTVPLSSKVQKILNKRKGHFPRAISGQKYNDYIKEVCQLAGITNKIKGSKISSETNRKENGTFEKWELVSSHIGRRSFATNNYGKIPTSLLIGATGHSTESMFLEYIGKSNSEKAIQLANYIN